MRTFPIAVLLALAVACTVNPADVANSTSDQSASIEVITDPTADVELEDSSGAERGPLGSETNSFCAAFAAVDLLWIEDAIVSLQIVIDAWHTVDEVPEIVADDVAAMRSLADRRMDWHVGRIAADQRPVIDLAMAEGLERIADHAAMSCDLPLVTGLVAEDPDWTASEKQAKCEQSEADLGTGIAWYERARGREPLHAQQIELAAWVELLRNPDEPEFWFAPDHHGIGRDGAVTAIGPCD